MKWGRPQALPLRLLAIAAVQALFFLPAAAADDAKRLAGVAIDEIGKDAALAKAALALGRKVYAANCVACHGAALKGVWGKHAPDLSDRAFLYGSDKVDLDPDVILASDIETTVRFGIRADHPKTRKLSFMPGYGGKDARQEGGYPTLSEQDIDDLAEYLVTLQGKAGDAARAARGKPQFMVQGCFDCHGRDAKGNPSIGATDLTSSKYLYGGDAAAIAASIRDGRKGTSPAFEGRLAADEIKAVAYYVFSAWERAPK